MKKRNFTVIDSRSIGLARQWAEEKLTISEVGRRLYGPGYVRNNSAKIYSFLARALKKSLRK